MNPARHSPHSEPPVSQSLNEAEERTYLERRDNITDEALFERMNAAPDFGGRILVELNEFVVRRSTK